MNTDDVSGARKAAILMVSIGDEASSAILRELDEEEIQLISQQIARVPSINSSETEKILEEFYQMSLARNFVIKGGIDYARKILVNALGPDQSKRMLDKLMKNLGNETLSFDALQKTDPQQLAKFIHSEHPQTIALVLSHLNASPGGRPADVTSFRAARRRGSADGQSGSDLTGNHFQDRDRDRP